MAESFRLDGKDTEIVGVFGPEEAKQVIQKCYNRYIDEFCR